MLFCRCPSCQARSRFNVIEQVVTPIKVAPETGKVQVLTELEPFHLPYQGPDPAIIVSLSLMIIVSLLTKKTPAEQFEKLGM